MRYSRLEPSGTVTVTVSPTARPNCSKADLFNNASSGWVGYEPLSMSISVKVEKVSSFAPAKLTALEPIEPALP